MERSRHRPTWLVVRFAFYILVVVAVFLLRGPDLRRGGGPLRFVNESDTVRTITLAGGELAPELVARMVHHYHEAYPDLRVTVQDGGTARALESMANRRASVGLMLRPPTAEEQAIVREAVGDTVLYFPFALGGIAVLAGNTAGIDSLQSGDLRRLLRGDEVANLDRLYAPDPNQGLWDALCAGLGIAGISPAGERLVFLADEAAVVQAVLADPRSIGIASTLSVPDSVELMGVRLVAVRGDQAAAAARPEYEAIGYGEYPLYHYLYAACIANSSVRGAMFVTHLTSDRGQRQVERAGFLPARQTSRTIYLTRRPPGGTQTKEEE
jgi:ABC-type phosphate transport system substrate-binding protein